MVAGREESNQERANGNVGYSPEVAMWCEQNEAAQFWQFMKEVKLN